MTLPRPPEMPQDLRIRPVPFTEWDEGTRRLLLAHLRRPEVYLSGDPDAPPMPVVLELFARHVPLSASWLPFTEMLAGGDSRLAPDHRELAILRVAWRTHSGYEWSQHRRMGAEAGLSEAQLEAVTVGPGSAMWTPLERALVAAVDEMVDRFAVGDDTWDALAGEFDEAQLLELLFLIGGYLCLATVLNSLGLQGPR